MKKKKIITTISLMTMTILPEIVYATDYIVCDTDKKFPKIFAEMTSTFMTIIKIMVPILLVISGMISFFKVTFSSKVEEDLKKAKSKLINNIIAATIIFLVFSIVNFAVSLVAGSNNKFMSCVNCFIDSDKCTIITESGKKICPGFMNDQTKYDENCNPIDNGNKNNNNNNKNNNNNNKNNNNNNNNNSSNGTIPNQTSNVGQAAVNFGLAGIALTQVDPTAPRATNPKIETRNGVTYVSDDKFKDILIVNKTYSIPESFQSTNNPSGLDNCTACLNQNVYDAFYEMQRAAQNEGINLWITSGYRSYNYQKNLYNSYVNTSGKEAADTFSARPGYSEHQTGLAFDLINASSSFDETSEAKWLDKNAYKYGFIIRYPKGKTNKTGYKYESWHLRYVGKELAQTLYNNGNWVTLEEYFGLTSKYSD